MAMENDFDEQSHSRWRNTERDFPIVDEMYFSHFQFLKLNCQYIETYLVKRPLFWILVLVLLILNSTFSAQTLGLASITLNDKKNQAKLDRLKNLIRFYFSALFQIVNHWWLASANFWLHYTEAKKRGRFLGISLSFVIIKSKHTFQEQPSKVNDVYNNQLKLVSKHRVYWEYELQCPQVLDNLCVTKRTELNHHVNQLLQNKNLRSIFEQLTTAQIHKTVRYTKKSNLTSFVLLPFYFLQFLTGILAGDNELLEIMHLHRPKILLYQWVFLNCTKSSFLNRGKVTL